MTTIRTTPTDAELRLTRNNPHLAFGWMLVTDAPRNFEFPVLSQPIPLHDGSYAMSLVATVDELSQLFRATSGIRAHYLLRDGSDQIPAYPTQECGDHLPKSTTTRHCTHLTVA